MKITRKIWIIAICSFALITICFVGLYFFNYVSIDTVVIFSALTQLFFGLMQINLAKESKSIEIAKGNKLVGIFTLMIGVVVLISVIIKIVLE